ncbi:ParB/RepB/Spo0J family partition protein [Rhodococcus sp. IEGM 1370]|jgi:ParB family chromosome partitioning protein|uniref:ParB/RepB/Spo0J family partition protein n=1 Tax=Rhodococcus sp. IEGM 1370 TaxID=3082222 RepID=UPI0029529BFD|nr:ParB/RepB/Spo0J family partition protein [Rhodococcus sp. IEGM 1370]MDV8078048.1 ParB/RepB/Spo0J family partition protein [Rhodococcus sp. IEGM 1370]
MTITTPAPTSTGYTLVDADPNELDITANVRTGVDITAAPEFIASITELGVRQAVLAVRRADGTLAVRDGQRRVLAAREAGLASIPVMVRDQTTDERAAGIERITEQINLNDQREALTRGQHAAGVAELRDLGLSVQKVATALHVPKAYVEKAGRAGRSERARQQLDDRQLTLEGAAILADLEDAAEIEPWVTDAVERVFEFGYGIENRLATIKRRVDERAATRVAAADHIARGFTLLHDEPSTSEGEWFSLADLRTADGGAVPADATERAPHLWHIHVHATGAIWVDKVTRDEVAEDDIDFDTEDDDNAEPDGDRRHANTVEKVPGWSYEFFLRHDNRAAAGLELAPERIAANGPSDDDAQDGLTPAQRKAARAEAERIEKERAERRKVKALNRAGATATEARRTFLTGLLSRKDVPKNATKWMVRVLATHGDVFTESKCGERYADIMGSPLREVPQKADSATVARAEVLLLARVLTAFEARLTGPQDAKDYWRFSAKHYRGMVGIDSYLTFLADSGHTLTPVEQAAIGNITVDDAYAAVDDDA